ncbi:hypothetical protein [Metabacillus fastidiosus]|nr:hypothetical protein [Metabacillus fastidiosus]MEC2076105.1 hypothetical protein [Metabacillus fastidiosus]
MTNKNITHKENQKLDINKIYQICENYGVSKEIISGFINLERKIQNEQNS